LIVRLSLGYRRTFAPNCFSTFKKQIGYKNILIIGVSNLAREISENSQMKYQVQGFVDDDPAFLNKENDGIPVLGW